MKKKKAFYALAVMILLGAGLVLFIVAAEEQSVISSGLPAADRIRLHDLITQGSGKNKHVELVDFYFGKQYIYAAKLVQFRDVYVPVCRCFLAESPRTQAICKSCSGFEMIAIPMSHSLKVNRIWIGSWRSSIGVRDP